MLCLLYVCACDLTIPGNVSAAELKYISLRTVENGTDYPPKKQMGAANIWGLTGQSYGIVVEDFTDSTGTRDPAVHTGEEIDDAWWHIFVDYAGDNDVTNYVTSTRTVNVTATCEELELLQGGYAGHDGSNLVQWTDRVGVTHERAIFDVNPGGTTWIGNMTYGCGDRCTEILVLQTANNLTAEDIQADQDLLAGETPVPEPRMWTW